MIKTALVATSLTFILAMGNAHAATDPAAITANCEKHADGKKLAGAARDAKIKKCEKDARLAEIKSTCADKAKEEKLAGAAKTSFLKKCEKDANAEATSTAPEAVDKMDNTKVDRKDKAADKK